MGKSVRKYRKSRDYDYVAPPPASSQAGDNASNSEDKHDKLATSAYAIIDASKRVPGSLFFAHHYQPYSDDDLLTSPHEFVPLADLAPGDCGPFHVLAVLVCACVGPSGALAMPFAFLQGGFLLTNVLVAIFAVTTVSASVWLVHLGVESGTYSLHGVSTLALGRFGAVIASGIQFVASAGRVLAGFLLLFDDLRVLLARSLHFKFDAYGDPIDSPPSSSAIVHAIGNLLTDRVLFAELTTLILVVPFCLTSFYYRKLKLSSTLSILALLIATASAIANAMRLHRANEATASQGFHRDYIDVPLSTFPQTIGMLGACFGYQHHAFHAFYAMRERSVAQFLRISVFAMVLSLFICYGVGVGGYVAFLKTTTTDVLNNYDFRSNTNNFAFWVAVPASAIVAIALEVVVSAHSVQLLTRSTWARSESDSKADGDVLFRAQHSTHYDPLGHNDGFGANTSPTPAGERLSDTPSLRLPKGLAWKRYLLTAVVLIATAQLAIFVDMDISSVLTLTGAFASLHLLFVLPSVFSFKLSRGQQGDEISSGGEWNLSRGMPLAGVVIGGATSVACIVSYAAGH